MNEFNSLCVSRNIKTANTIIVHLITKDEICIVYFSVITSYEQKWKGIASLKLDVPGAYVSFECMQLIWRFLEEKTNNRGQQLNFIWFDAFFTAIRLIHIWNFHAIKGTECTVYDYHMNADFLQKNKFASVEL